MIQKLSLYMGSSIEISPQVSVLYNLLSALSALRVLCVENFPGYATAGELGAMV